MTILSDGLERGDPTPMIEAVRRFSRIAWRLDWLSPLAADPDYEPATGGFSAIFGDLDALADGSTTDAAVDHMLSLARAA